jgi:nucleoside-diphosphate-sugar epimerase
MRILVIGLTGQVGAALAPKLPADAEVWALSRAPHESSARLRWLPGSLEAMPDLPAGIDTVLSLGPLDAFVAWFESAGLAPGRVVALSSTGRDDKRDSTDPAERRIAEVLDGAERRLFELGRERGANITVLRPTLIYGGGRDRTLSAMVALARRFGVVVLPVGATGLRQPVHVEDVAGAVLACLRADATAGRAYDLPGGETISFRAMVERSIGRQRPGTPVWTVPRWLFQSALAVAGRFGFKPVSSGFADRAARDQTADPSEAQRDFGYRPRRFEP